MNSSDRIEIGTARASPTKDFFVRMLTRDIELADALLDLLDNCLDGILRTADIHSDGNRPYDGYRAIVTLSEASFKIEDNCGGIPIEVAKKYAFAMGRPPGATDKTPATIGMYGIGMKRAIFKLGTDAVVESRYGDEAGFYVTFTSEWTESDEWTDLTVYALENEELEETGTRIEVLQLGQEARAFFSDVRKVDEFRTAVARHYALILAKGFDVIIGTPAEIAAGRQPIEPEVFRLLDCRDDLETAAIRPLIYTGKIDDVRVEVYAGLYRPLLSPEELEKEEQARGSKDDAGWTVACNDRVVVWKDKTRLTGWGEATVPNYHGQFIPVTGIALLYSDDPRQLPLTTTKRGIDGASNVYSMVKDLMREATKSLTAFTNRWKKFPEQRDTLYRTGVLRDLSELRSSVNGGEFKLRRRRKPAGVFAFVPDLPRPKNEQTQARVSFLADKTDIRIVGNHLFEDSAWKNEDVGKASFELALAQAKPAK